MDNKRIEQLAFMFSNITGKTKDESRKIILETDTGKAICMNNMTVMYEQQTENLFSIAMELMKMQQYVQTANLLTIKNIREAMKMLGVVEKKMKASKIEGVTHIAKQPELKGTGRKQLLSKRKNLLQIKKQNQLNVRRIENAVEFKR